jgi:DNA-directed RNA polymerase specialized sigma subunit
MLYKAILRLPEEEMRIIGMMLDEYWYKQIDIARLWWINFKHISDVYKSALVKLRTELEWLQH